MTTMNGDCRQVRDRMDSYVSGELTVESNHDVLRHLERCESCRTEMARRERTRVSRSAHHLCRWRYGEDKLVEAGAVSPREPSK